MEISNKDFLPLANGVLTMISGAGGVGKGFVSLQSVIRYLTEKEEATALLWYAEDAQRVLASRLKLFNVDTSIIERMTFLSISPRDYKGWQSKISKFDIIILDPLVYFYEDNENDNGEASAFMSLLNKQCVKSDNIMIVVHHHSKSGQTRGASAFTDNARLVYQLTVSAQDGAPDKAVDVNVLKDNFNVCQKEISYIVPQKMTDAETVEETF